MWVSRDVLTFDMAYVYYAVMLYFVEILYLANGLRFAFNEYKLWRHKLGLES